MFDVFHHESLRSSGGGKGKAGKGKVGINHLSLPGLQKEVGDKLKKGHLIILFQIFTSFHHMDANHGNPPNVTSFPICS